MKKILSVFLLVLILVCSSLSAFAAESKELSFNTYDSKNNENICVDVVISGTGKPSMMQFCLAYDSDVLEVESINFGDAFDGATAPMINHIDGKIYFIWDSLNALQNNGTVLNIEYKKLSEKGTSVYIDKTESFVVADSSFKDIGVVKGEATIAGSSSVSISSGSSSEGNFFENISASGSSEKTSSESNSEEIISGNSSDKTGEKPNYSEEIKNDENGKSETIEENVFDDGTENKETTELSENNVSEEYVEIQVVNKNFKESGSNAGLFIAVGVALVLGFISVLIFIIKRS